MIANKKARMMKDAPEAIMHMIDSKWNHLKGVGLLEHYNKSAPSRHAYPQTQQNYTIRSGRSGSSNEIF